MVSDAAFQELSNRVESLFQSQEDGRRRSVELARSVEELRRSFNGLKVAIEGITGRLPMPITPLCPVETRDPSKTTGGDKLTPDLTGSGNPVMKRASIVSKPPTYDEISTIGLVERNEISYVSARQSIEELHNPAKFVAHQVFAEMPEPQQGLKQSMFKVFEVNSLHNAPSLHNATFLLRVNSEFLKKHRLLNGLCASMGYVTAICFDPGGLSMPYDSHPLNQKCLLRENGGLWCTEKIGAMRYSFGAATVGLSMNPALNYRHANVSVKHQKWSLVEEAWLSLLVSENDMLKLLNRSLEQEEMMKDCCLAMLIFYPRGGLCSIIDPSLAESYILRFQPWVNTKENGIITNFAHDCDGFMLISNADYLPNEASLLVFGEKLQQEWLDEDNLDVVLVDLATFSMVEGGCNRFVYDPGGGLMLFGAASFSSNCESVTTSEKIDMDDAMDDASSFPNILGTGSITPDVNLERVTWEFGLRFTFDPGGRCSRFIKISKIIESILEDKDHFKRGVLMQDFEIVLSKSGSISDQEYPNPGY